MPPKNMEKITSNIHLRKVILHYRCLPHSLWVQDDLLSDLLSISSVQGLLQLLLHRQVNIQDIATLFITQYRHRPSILMINHPRYTPLLRSTQVWTL